MSTSTDRRHFARYVNLVVLTSSAAALGALALGGPPADWALVGLFVVVMLGPGKATLVMPSEFALSAGTLINCAAIAAVPGHGRLLAAWLVGACDGLEWQRLRRGRSLVVAFNVAELGLAGLAAALAYDLAGGHGVGAVVISCVTYPLVNTALVGPGVLLQSGQRASLSLLLDLQTMAVEPLLAASGLLVGAQYHRHGPWVVAAMLGPVLGARAVWWFLSRTRYAYERLEAVHAFTRELESAPTDGEPARWLLALLAERVGAPAATAVSTIGGTTLRTSHRADGYDVVTLEHPPAWVDLEPTRVASLEATDPRRRALEADGLGAGMVVPLQVDGRHLATLAVAGPDNQRSYTVADLRLLETFATNAAAWLERRRLFERVHHDSTHDPLTDLPNRRHFLDLVDAAPRPVAVLLAGLDRFKDVNDTLGHDQGDVLLRAVAERLSETFPDAIVARLGGDEFGLAVTDLSNGDAAAAAVHLLTCLEAPFEVGALRLEMTAGVGLTVDHDATPALELLQHADIAMARAKASHSGWELHDPERDRHSPWRLSLASDLRRGIDLGQLEVHYQPKARLHDGRVIGLEALVRWRHPRYGLLSPDQFVPVAEQAGLIRPLTMAVLADACAEHVALRRLGVDLTLAVNLSVRSLLDVNLPDQVAEVLSSHGVAPDRLTLEITEGSLMADPARTIGILGRLSDLGAAISIDDFGTGYSSLGYLKRLPADEVKIDRSFVSGMRRDPSDAAIVRSTVELAHNLGLRAVAEGVEDPGTWHDLAGVGCDEAQGYYLSAPLGAGALRAWVLRSESIRSPRPD